MIRVREPKPVVEMSGKPGLPAQKIARVISRLRLTTLYTNEELRRIEYYMRIHDFAYLNEVAQKYCEVI